MADCSNDGLQTFADGIRESVLCDVDDANSRRGGHKSLIDNLLRYADYFFLPLRCLSVRKKYDIILGWQQFHAIIMAFYCRLFRLKKHGLLVAVNFTYKRKPGLAGSVYQRFMRYSCNNVYLDYLHVPSYNYVERMHAELGIPREKFIVTGFGIDDIKNRYENAHTGLPDYCLSIGRSNRDFDWLVDVWRQDCLKDKRLVILSDVWSPSKPLPGNVTWRNDVIGQPQYAYFNDARLCITPIADGNICSGDTVLLTGMMFGKPVAVTSPSTLSEMYVRDNVNGICLTKNTAEAAKAISALLDDEEECMRLGSNARHDFLEKFSRKSMGRDIMCQIVQAR